MQWEVIIWLDNTGRDVSVDALLCSSLLSCVFFVSRTISYSFTIFFENESNG
jgi:hypothetical protein